MELIYRPTGQKIMFRGADGPMKLKSSKVPFCYIAVTHFGEKDQFMGRREITNILQSTMRGGSIFWNFESCKPHLSQDNWVNPDSMKERADRLYHRSTYLDAPPKWLEEQFLIEAEHRRLTDERAYRHEYLGKDINRAYYRGEMGIDQMLHNEAGERLVEGYERTRNATLIAEAYRVSERQVSGI